MSERSNGREWMSGYMRSGMSKNRGVCGYGQKVLQRCERHGAAPPSAGIDLESNDTTSYHKLENNDEIAVRVSGSEFWRDSTRENEMFTKLTEEPESGAMSFFSSFETVYNIAILVLGMYLLYRHADEFAMNGDFVLLDYLLLTVAGELIIFIILAFGVLLARLSFGETKAPHAFPGCGVTHAFFQGLLHYSCFFLGGYLFYQYCNYVSDHDVEPEFLKKAKAFHVTPPNPFAAKPIEPKPDDIHTSNDVIQDASSTNSQSDIKPYTKLNKVHTMGEAIFSYVETDTLLIVYILNDMLVCLMIIINSLPTLYGFFKFIKHKLEVAIFRPPVVEFFQPSTPNSFFNIEYYRNALQRFRS